MIWLLTIKPAYITGYLELPQPVQVQANVAHANLLEAPDIPVANTIKKLQGWQNVWRYQLGEHWLIYALQPEQKLIQLLAAGPQPQVYARFESLEKRSLTFDTGLVSNETTAAHRDPKNPLPRQLTTDLLQTWHIPKDHHSALLACQTEAELLAAHLPTSHLERITEALWPSRLEAIARQPDCRLFNPDDLDRYVAGDLAGFVLHLDETQRAFAAWALAGPTLIKGGPGTGKSTLALYRTRAVIEHATKEDDAAPSVLFLTYTNTLVSLCRSRLAQLLENSPDLAAGKKAVNIQVTTVDQLALDIARKSGFHYELANLERRVEALAQARLRLKPRAMGDLEQLARSQVLRGLDDNYLLAEFEWVISGQSCQSEADYLDANRTGRGIPLSPFQRQTVWQIYTHYRRFLETRNLATWGQLRGAALRLVRSGRFKERWDYVLVDEAQELPPATLALCIELCSDPRGLFLTADANQSIYNRGFRWQHVHQQLRIAGRTRILRRNYRNTFQIGQAASALLAGMARFDQPSLSQEFVLTGTRPLLYAAADLADQARWLAEQIQSACQALSLPLGEAVVLVPSPALGPPLADRLAQLGLPARFIPSNTATLPEEAIKVMTLYAAKGLEFPIVALAHVEADHLPRSTASSHKPDRREDHYSQLRLFYVGCTRAMHRLFVTYNRDTPSPFLQKLSDDTWGIYGVSDQK